MVELKLKNCPFCKAPGIAAPISGPGGFFAGCSDPDCIAHQVAYDFVSLETAAAAWNTRSEAPLPSENKGDLASRASLPASPVGLTEGQTFAGLTEPYRPVAIHFAEPDMLEYVERDEPVVTRAVHPGLDVLLTIDGREPIGWRIYGWSKVAPPAETGASSPSEASTGNPATDEPISSPQPSGVDRRELAQVVSRATAIANLIERPPLDDVQLERTVAVQHAADLRALIAALSPSPGVDREEKQEVSSSRESVTATPSALPADAANTGRDPS